MVSSPNTQVSGVVTRSKPSTLNSVSAPGSSSPSMVNCKGFVSFVSVRARCCARTRSDVDREPPLDDCVDGVPWVKVRRNSNSGSLRERSSRFVPGNRSQKFLMLSMLRLSIGGWSWVVSFLVLIPECISWANGVGIPLFSRKYLISNGLATTSLGCGRMA